MAKKNWMKQLQSLEGVAQRRNIHETVIQSPSPSFNFMFGKGHGLPLGSSLLAYGPPKSGKSLVGYALAGQLHRDDPEAIVIKFNTEFREGQLTDEGMKTWGIDPDRYIGLDVNHPALIYDQMEKQVQAWMQDGLPLKLVIIDSMNGVQGRRGTDSDSIMNQQIGDVALTNKEGLKRLLPLQHAHRFGLYMTCHVAIEMDRAEQMRGNKYRMGAGVGVQHHAEYFVYMEENVYKEGQKDFLGREMVNADLLAGIATKHGEKTGHKIRAVMKHSTFGPKGRMAEFTLDYNRGIVSTHEEVFQLGVNRNIVNRPNQLSYEFGGKRWSGKETFLEALRQDPDLQEQIMKELRVRDWDNRFGTQDQATAQDQGLNEIDAEVIAG